MIHAKYRLADGEWRVDIFKDGERVAGGIGPLARCTQLEEKYRRKAKEKGAVKNEL